MSKPSLTVEVRVDAEAIERLDAVQALLTQADAVLSLVTNACGDTLGGIAVDQATLAHAVWAAQTLVHQALERAHGAQ